MSYLRKMQEFEQLGYYHETCPACGFDMVRVEIDASHTCCEECGHSFEVTPVI